VHTPASVHRQHSGATSRLVHGNKSKKKKKTGVARVIAPRHQRAQTSRNQLPRTPSAAASRIGTAEIASAKGRGFKPS